MDKRLKVNFCPWPNFGDHCVPYILEKLNIPHIFTHHVINKKITMIGSIIRVSTQPETKVWGTGLMFANDGLDKRGEFIALRGPRTYERVKELGGDVSNTILGDPALLLPRAFTPSSTEKKYKLGIIPHMMDGEVVRYMKDNPDKFENSIFINPHLKLNEIDKFLELLNQCEKVVSTCLHGVIAAHAFNIPVRWMKVGDKVMGDDVKFHDHFESLDLKAEPLSMIDSEDDEQLLFDNTSHQDKLKQIQDDLWRTRPWLNLSDDYYVDIDDKDWTKQCYPEDYNSHIVTREWLIT